MAKQFPRGIYEKIPGSKIFWIRYTDAAGNERREKCGNLTAAKNRLDTRRAERQTGEVPDKPRALLFGTLLDDALAHIKSENDAYAARDLEYKLERIRADFGKTPVARIQRADIQRWLEAETEKRKWAPASRNRYQAAWSLVFRVARDNKKLKDNPASGIKRKQENNQRVRYLTLDEEMKLLAAIEERFPLYVPVVQLAIHLGPRASELLRARVGDFDARTGMFKIRQRKVRTAAPNRYVPATPIAIAAYERLAAGKKPGAVLCSKQERRGDLDLRSTNYWFDPCAKAAGIEDLRWHDLRHTFASRLVMGNTPLAVVSEYMGHRSITMTMRYSHMSPTVHSKAVKTMMDFYQQKATGTEGGPVLVK